MTQAMHYINLTPHVVRLNDGREFPPSGTVARVAASYPRMMRRPDRGRKSPDRK